MEPAFARGDILFLTNFAHESYRTGDILVYKIPGADIPIVHRVIEARDIMPTPSTPNPVPGCALILHFVEYITIKLTRWCVDFWDSFRPATS